METALPTYVEDLNVEEHILRPTMRRVRAAHGEESFQRQVRSQVRKQSQHGGQKNGRRRSLRTIGSRNGLPPLPGTFSQRVVVQARVVKHGAQGKELLQKHVHYMQRDGVGYAQERGTVYGTIDHTGDVANVAHEDAQNHVPEPLQHFIEQCANDRHSFRFILSPEYAHKLDLTLYTKGLMHEMEKDLGTTLQWIAVNHYNTDNPHTHIVVRGVDDKGKDLVIDPQYISQGLRYQAMHLATLELGPRTAIDIQRTLVSDVTKERFTQWDKLLLQHCAGNNTVDLRYEAPSPSAIFRKKQLLGRVRHLEQMGLVKRVDQSGFLWEVSPDLEQALKALGTRGDIIKTMHRAMQQGKEREPQQQPQHYRIFNPGDPATPSITGRVTANGLVNELYDREYVIIEAQDGYAYYVALGNHKDATMPTKGDLVTVSMDTKPGNGIVLTKEGTERHKPLPQKDRG